MNKFLQLYKEGNKVSACPKFDSQYFKKEKGCKKHCPYKRKIVSPLQLVSYVNVNQLYDINFKQG